MNTKTKKMKSLTLYTVGYTKKSAEVFFTSLQDHRIDVLVDVRLNTQSQLAAFAKASDLIYFLRTLIQCEYVHLSAFAPTKEILKSYQAKSIDWQQYEEYYKAHIQNVSLTPMTELLTQKTCCLLCSELSAEHCHRRLLAEYIASHQENITVKHI